ncbi:hypothetical protein [Streptomyces sp. NPDC016172]|uniref:hypothetical protein n=1 Tax=Streptomyces sp. NPDC016172 TaxID=3364964 RepID=UPI0036F985DD
MPTDLRASPHPQTCAHSPRAHGPARIAAPTAPRDEAGILVGRTAQTQAVLTAG